MPRSEPVRIVRLSHRGTSGRVGARGRRSDRPRQGAPGRPAQGLEQEEALVAERLQQARSRKRRAGRDLLPHRLGGVKGGAAAKDRETAKAALASSRGGRGSIRPSRERPLPLRQIDAPPRTAAAPHRGGAEGRREAKFARARASSIASGRLSRRRQTAVTLVGGDLERPAGAARLTKKPGSGFVREGLEGDLSLEAQVSGVREVVSTTTSPTKRSETIAATPCRCSRSSSTTADVLKRASRRGRRRLEADRLGDGGGGPPGIAKRSERDEERPVRNSSESPPRPAAGAGLPEPPAP